MTKADILRLIAMVTRRVHPRGTMRLARLLHNPDRRQQDWIETVLEYDSGMSIFVSTASYIEWSIFFFGSYETDTVRLIKNVFRPNFVAIDVGANVGVFTLIMAAHAREGRVIAIEPHPDVFARLARNIDLNRLQNVTLRQCALSDASGAQTLFSFAPGAANQGASSFYAGNVAGGGPQLSVAVTTLDEIMSSPGAPNRLDFVKIDTEGNEARVLLGARQSLRKYRPQVLFEYDQRTWRLAGGDLDRLQDFFAELRYELYAVQRGSHEPLAEKHRSMSVNLLAIPKANG